MQFSKLEANPDVGIEMLAACSRHRPRLSLAAEAESEVLGQLGSRTCIDCMVEMRGLEGTGTVIPIGMAQSRVRARKS